METNSIKKYYLNRFPDDKELGKQLNDISFEDVHTSLKKSKEIYEVLGVVDSIVREGIFEGLAKYLNTSYNYVFRTWLDNNYWKQKQ